MQPAPSAEKRVRASRGWFCFSLVEKVAQSQSIVKLNQSKREITFDTQLKTELKPKPKQLLRLISTDITSATNQSELELNTCNRRQTREKRGWFFFFEKVTWILLTIKQSQIAAFCQQTDSFWQMVNCVLRLCDIYHISVGMHCDLQFHDLNKN